MDELRPIPRTVLVTLMLISLNAVFWLGFAVMAALGGIAGFSAGNLGKWLLAGLALGTAACLGGLVYYLARRKRIAFYTATILLGIILVLSITDQVGLWDVLTMLSVLAALVLLLKDRKWYLGGQAGDHDAGGGEK